MALSQQELLEKLKDKTLTLKEAAEFARQEGKNSEVNPIISGSFFKKTGLPETTKYSDLTNDEVMKALDPDWSQDSANRWGIISTLENAIRPVFENTEIGTLTEVPEGASVAIKVYPRITNNEQYAQSKGYYGVKKTNEQFRPMSGLIRLEDFDTYFTSILEPVQERMTQLAMMYHRNTGNRVSQLINTGVKNSNALKKSDIKFNEADGTVTVAGGGTGNKRRNEITYDQDSEPYKIIKEAFDLSKNSTELFAGVTPAKLQTAYTRGRKFLIENHLTALPIKNARLFSSWINETYGLPVPDLSKQGDVLVKLREDASNVSGQSAQEIMEAYLLATADDTRGGVVTSPSITRSAVMRAYQEQFELSESQLRYAFGHLGKDQARMAYTAYTPELGTGKQIAGLSYNSGYDPTSVAEVALPGESGSGTATMIGIDQSTLDPDIIAELNEVSARERITSSEKTISQDQLETTQNNIQKFLELSSPEGQEYLRLMPQLAEQEQQAEEDAFDAREVVRKQASEKRRLRRQEEEAEERKFTEEESSQFLNMLRSLGIEVDDEEDIDISTSMGELLASDTGPKTLSIEAMEEEQDNRKQDKKPFGSTVLDPIGQALTKMRPAVRALEVGQFAIEKIPPMMESAMQSETAKNLGQRMLAPYEIDESSTDEDVLNAMQDFAARTKGYR